MKSIRLKSFLISVMTFFTFFAVLLSRISSVQAETNPQWKIGAGLGPNFSKLDAVGDDLKSSYGATVFLQRNWDEHDRLDLALDYLDFSGADVHHASLSVAYGLRFWKDSFLKPFAMLGVGVGQASSFPGAIDTNQTPWHFFGRFGSESLYQWKKLDLGILVDVMHIKLDGNTAESADIALPMATLTYTFGDSEPSPQPAPVIAKAAPKDSDGDGVYDDLDACPNTPPNVKVNSIGCQETQVVKKDLRIEFEINKAEILPEYEFVIQEFADFLKRQSDLKVTIEGHTDSIGNRDWNKTLSKMRADAVRTKLIQSHGIEASRLDSVGYGPDKPETDNKTKANRKKNRRVIGALRS